jgi:hypothetical protein
VAEDLFDQCVLGGLDERNDAHAPAATGADQGIDTPHLLDEGRPAAAGDARARRVLVIDLDGVAVFAIGFGAQAACLVRHQRRRHGGLIRTSRTAPTRSAA